MWAEEVGIGGGKLRQYGKEGRLLGMWDGGEGIEHRIHEREGLRLLREITGRKESDGRAEGRQANLADRIIISSRSAQKWKIRDEVDEDERTCIPADSLLTDGSDKNGR